MVWLQTPGRRQGGVTQEGMFWELVPEDVIETPAGLNGADFEREWRRRKHKMEKASRRPWTEFENSPITVQLRKYALREFSTRVSGTQMFNPKLYSPML